LLQNTCIQDYRDKINNFFNYKFYVLSKDPTEPFQKSQTFLKY